MKTVALHIQVPDGDYCWDPRNGMQDDVCDFFDNTGGHGTCTLGLWGVKHDKKSGAYVKAPVCKDLIAVDK